MRFLTAALLLLLASCNLSRDNVYDPSGTRPGAIPVPPSAPVPKSFSFDRHFAGAGQIQVGQLAFASDGSILATIINSNQVWKFSKNGDKLGILGRPDGSAGSGPSEFSSPCGLAVDRSGNIYVSEFAGAKRVQKFGSNFNFLLQWGSPGSGNGQFTTANVIAISQSGKVVVGDQDAYRVQIFDSSGNFLFLFGGWGSGNGLFQRIASLAIDSSGSIYVSDANIQRVQKFDSTGAFLKILSSGFIWGGLGLDPKGMVLIARYAGISRMNQDGVILGEYSFNVSDPDASFAQPVSLLWDLDAIYVADNPYSYRITKFRPAY